MQIFVDALRRRISDDTVRSTWNHLRTVFNFARAVQALETTPRAPRLPPADGNPQALSDQQLSAIYRQIRAEDLRIAFVLAANCGPRTVDLFGLSWERNVRSEDQLTEINYTAEKTGKKHWMPLAPVTLAHLQRLASETLFEPAGLVFPRLTSGVQCQDPERSHAARRRNRWIKAAFVAAGIEGAGGKTYKPWQALRHTCITRLNRHGGTIGSPGIGKWLLHGPDRDVQSQSYYDRTPEALKAVLTLPHPDEFLQSSE